MRFTTLLAVPFLFASVRAAVEKVSLEDVTPAPTSTLGKRTFCLDANAIYNCVRQGMAVNWDCSCSRSCGCSDQHNCENNGGTYNPSTCACTYPSGGSNPGNTGNNGYNWWWNNNAGGFGVTIGSGGTISIGGVSIGGGGGGWWGKRELPARGSSKFCPSPYFECPVPKGSHPMGSTFSVKGKMYECLDILSDVESCGGCQSQGSGQDCTAIENVQDVSCGEGRCIVASCERGWVPSPDRDECIRDPKAKGGLFTQNRR